MAHSRLAASGEMNAKGNIRNTNSLTVGNRLEPYLQTLVATFKNCITK